MTKFGIMQNEMRLVREVTSNQTDIFEHLESTVLRYVHTTYKRPFAEHTQKAFECADDFVKNRKCPVVLDSGCGTGESSFSLSKRFPDCTVIALDKSFKRLSKNASDKEDPKYSGILFLRAELLDFWRLVLTSDWNVIYHALYYPNPWPKSSEATRRFHLSPVFPAFLSLSLITELRTNWDIYAKEFEAAAHIAGNAMGIHLDTALETFIPHTFETAFERKYALSSQTLYRVILNKKGGA